MSREEKMTMMGRIHLFGRCHGLDPVLILFPPPGIAMQPPRLVNEMVLCICNWLAIQVSPVLFLMDELSFSGINIDQMG
jgi:hypothetical protein